MQRIIRIGTRDSQLALWQANKVKQLLEQRNINIELVPVKSEGDLDLITPLYAMGVQGVFTKTLDAYLLSNKIDIAVHSFKDVPTQLAHGLHQAAVLERASSSDVFVPHKNYDVSKQSWTIATGSVRRKAQWLNKYPKSNFENLRGNLQTRFKKLAESEWDGAIFAEAGLDRMCIKPKDAIILDWMLPAPAQGVIMVACRQNDIEIREIADTFNNTNAEICARLERDFLKTLMGGCSTPIGALATIKNDTIYFKGNIVSPDGTMKLEIEKEVPFNIELQLGVNAANELLQNGAMTIIEKIRNAAN